MALKYMVDRGWLFAGTLFRDQWKNDPELVRWLDRGWIEFDPGRGFRITPSGVEACRK